MTRTFSGERLRAKRRAAGLTVEQLATSIDRTAYSIHGYELGRTQPPINLAAQMTTVLGCRLEDLLTDA